MRNRLQPAHAVLASTVAVSAISAFVGYTNDPQPADPTTAASWRNLSTYRWMTADNATLVLRFMPDAIGVPTLLAVVDRGASAPELWYLPWIHDSVDPDAEPLPPEYIDALADAFVHFGAQVDVVGIEGDLWGWDIRDGDVSPYAEETIGADAVDNVRTVQEIIAREEMRLLPLLPIAPDGVDRATDALLAHTATPVIGVEDPDLLILTDAEKQSQTIDLDRSRNRSRTAIVVLLTELEIRGGRRALLIFGMAHYAEIAEHMREFEDATLRVACIPALCALEDDAP